MHVAVIGAGAAGLCAARHLTAPNSGFTCVVFEQSDTIGGIWVYTEQTGLNQYGLSTYSPAYKNLRTNSPKEILELPGYSFSHSKSFVPAADVLQYLQDYTKHYKLEKHIRFLSHVKRVTCREGKWKITVVDLPTKEESETEFDAVVVCNGHHSVPFYGDFPGISEFGGQVTHSYCYREPEPYANKSVLLCGAGRSGTDIAYDLANYASQIYLSQRTAITEELYPENVKISPVVREVKEDHVVFEDGTTSGHIDAIIICTGYLYSFPFLTPECGITVEEGKFVQPLYKHIVNINEPTMAFIGLLFRTFTIPLFDIQVRFFIKTLTGEVKLPSKEDMMSDLNEFIQQKKTQNVPLRYYFGLGKEMKAYLNDLEEMGQLEPISPVVYDVLNVSMYLWKNHLPIYKDAVFEIIDENNFRLSGLNFLVDTDVVSMLTTQLSQTVLEE